MGIDVVFVTSEVEVDESEHHIETIKKNVDKRLQYTDVQKMWTINKDRMSIELIEKEMRTTCLWVIPQLMIIYEEIIKLGLDLREHDFIFTDDFYIGIIRTSFDNDTYNIKITKVPRNIDGDDTGIQVTNITPKHLKNYQNMDQFIESVYWKGPS